MGKLLQVESALSGGHQYYVYTKPETARALARIYAVPAADGRDKPNMRIQDFMRSIVEWYAERYDPETRQQRD